MNFRRVDPQAYDEVMSFLAGLFSPDPVPSFEVTPRTVSLLLSLRESNATRDAECSLLARDKELRAAEARAVASSVARALSHARIEPSRLSSLGSECAECISEVAFALNSLATTSREALLARLSRSLSEADCLREDEEEDARGSEQVLSVARDGIARLNELRGLLREYSDTDPSASAEADTRTRDMEYLDSKARQYSASESRLRDAVAASGVSAESVHGSLVAFSERVRALREALAPLSGRLRGYRDLPPDLTRATMEVERARGRLFELEENLAKSMMVSR